MCSISSTVQREEIVKSNNIMGWRDDKAACKPDDLRVIPQGRNRGQTSVTQMSKYNKKSLKSNNITTSTVVEKNVA